MSTFLELEANTKQNAQPSVNTPLSPQSANGSIRKDNDPMSPSGASVITTNSGNTNNTNTTNTNNNGVFDDSNTKVLSSTEVDAALRYLSSARAYTLFDRKNDEFLWSVDTRRVADKKGGTSNEFVLQVR